jgi:hypothetical protein
LSTLRQLDRLLFFNNHHPRDLPPNPNQLLTKKLGSFITARKRTKMMNRPMILNYLTSGLPVMLRMSCIPQMPTAVPVAKKSGHTSGRIHRFDHDPAAADAIVRIGGGGRKHKLQAGRSVSFVARKTSAG